MSACFSGSGEREGRGEWYRRARLGILFIIIGTVWFMARVGWIDGSLFFPLAMIIVGLWICLTSAMSKRKAEREALSSGHRPDGSTEIPR
jgi:hypothetical protein